MKYSLFWNGKPIFLLKQITLKEDISLCLLFVFGWFSLGTMIAHSYWSSSLGSVCVLVLSLETPPQRLCLNIASDFTLRLQSSGTGTHIQHSSEGKIMCLVNIGAHQSVSDCMHTGIFISVHKCQQENEHGETEPLYSLHWTVLLYYPFSSLFPLRQLFIIYPAGAINEKNKFYLCWLMQKPHNFPAATAGRKGTHVLCLLEQG